MESSDDPVLFDVADGVATIRFNRPGALNALDEALAAGFLQACRQAADRGDVRAVVIGGEGRGFMAGGDVARMVQALPRADTVIDALLDCLEPALVILSEMTAPVIASVHGAVAGAGASLMLAADLAIAADDTRINLAYSAIGATPDAASTWTLPRLVGLRRSMEIALLSEPIGADDALALGLVNRVVPRSALAAETDRLTRRLASGPTLAYGRIKRLLRGSFDRTMQQQMACERTAFRESTATADFAEGTRAFIEKRRPRFTGE